jgi:tetratricopeptide (TPR) repeat protein
MWRPALGLLGTAFFVLLSPSSSIVPIATEVGAERRMYLPLVTVVVLAVCTFAAVLERRRAAGGWNVTRWAGAGALVAVVAAFSAVTIDRNLDYRDVVGLWRSVVDSRPHGRAHANLGTALYLAGQREEAIAEYQRAVVDAPGAHINLAGHFAAGGKLDEAIAHYREYIRRLPDEVEVLTAFNGIGKALVEQGKPDEAADAFLEVLKRHRSNVEAHRYLADIRLAQERFDEAAEHYRIVLGTNAADAAAHSGLGVTLVSQKRLAEALPEFERAVTLDPTNAGYRQNFASALADSGRLDDGIVQLREAIRLAPASAPMHFLLGAMLAQTGKVPEAAGHFEQAWRISPDDPQIREAYIAALYRTGRADAAKSLQR